MRICSIIFAPLLLFAFTISVLLPMKIVLAAYSAVGIYILISFLELEWSDNFQFFKKSSFIRVTALYALSAYVLLVVTYNLKLALFPNMINLLISYVALYSILLFAIFIIVPKNNYVESLCKTNLFAMTFSGILFLYNNLNTDFVLLYFISVMFFISVYSMVSKVDYGSLEYRSSIYTYRFSTISIFVNMVFSYFLSMSHDILELNFISILSYELLFIMIGITNICTPVRSFKLLKVEVVLITLLLVRGMFGKLLGFVDLPQDININFGYLYFNSWLLMPLLFIITILNRKYFSYFFPHPEAKTY